MASLTASRASHEDRSAPEWYAGLVFLPAFLANSLAATRRLSRYELWPAGCGDHSAHRVVGGDYGWYATRCLPSGYCSWVSGKVAIVLPSGRSRTKMYLPSLVTVRTIMPPSTRK